MTINSDHLWFSLCNISLNIDKSEILERWKYDVDAQGNMIKTLLGHMKITVEMLPLEKHKREK
jgi:hypothetical protein